MKFVLLLLICLSPLSSWAQAEVARVKMLRGEASMKNNGKKTPLVVDQAVIAGSVVETGDKSFVRLIFTDKSQMNIGPNSEMEIKQFGGDDAGVIDLVKGKIRSQVSKDYLQQKDKDKSKLFIKTPNAVMGVRGTDFLISTNGVTTSTVLFEGEIVFNKLDNASSKDFTTEGLESVVSGPGTARIQPGEFSVQNEGSTQPTVPSVLNVQQMETLEVNIDFSQERAPGQQATEASTKSIVPPGLSGEVAANQPDALKIEISQVVSDISSAQPGPKSDAAAASGFELNGQLKPTNGSYLHVDSGVVIPPPKDSLFDANSNSFIPAGGGQVSADGNYQPPKNVTITDGGKIIIQVNNQMVEVKSSSSVMGRGATLGDVMKAMTGPTANIQLPSNGGAMDAGRVVANSEPSAPKLSASGAFAQASNPPIEAPTLCSTCGGAIPGSAANIKETSSVTFIPSVE